MGIEALVDAIKELDKSVAKATELRKEQHEDFLELMTSDSAAKKLLEWKMEIRVEGCSIRRLGGGYRNTEGSSSLLRRGKCSTRLIKGGQRLHTCVGSKRGRQNAGPADGGRGERVSDGHQ